MNTSYKLLDIPPHELRKEVDPHYGTVYHSYRQCWFGTDQLPVVLCDNKEFDLLKRYAEYVADSPSSIEYNSGEDTIEFIETLEHYEGTSVLATLYSDGTLKPNTYGSDPEIVTGLKEMPNTDVDTHADYRVHDILENIATHKALVEYFIDRAKTHFNALTRSNTDD